MALLIYHCGKRAPFFKLPFIRNIVFRQIKKNMYNDYNPMTNFCFRNYNYNSKKILEE